MADKEEIEKEEEKKRRETDAIKEKLSENVIKGKWKLVEKMYKHKLKELKEVRRMKITQSGATALHIAVYEGKEEIVKTLVRRMKKKDLKEEDYRGNTPLHLAAKMGSVAMCECIALKASRLIGIRNHDDETPLFLTALHGMTDAFKLLCTIYLFDNNNSWKDRLEDMYTCGRRNSDGRTVLHCAIDGEYFEMAYYIIGRFPRFLKVVDERGYTPFHLLASKQSSFTSSCRLTLLQKLIYPCVPVPDKVEEYIEDISLAKAFTEVDPFPEKDAIQGEHRKGNDIENPPLPYQRKRNLCQKVKHLYERGLRSLVFFFPKYMVEMKKTHSFALLIKNTLLGYAGYDDYLDGGRKPRTDVEGISFQKKDAEGIEVPDMISKSLCDTFTLSFWDTQQSIDVTRFMDKVTDGLVSLEKSSRKNKTKTETPILVAAKNGISEIVEDILKKFPATLHEVNSEGKNLMLLAVENRQPQVCQMLLEKYIDKTKENLFFCLDHEGNSALHLAAMLTSYQPWLAPDAVLQMQWEIKWYKYIEKHMPKHLLAHQNNEGKTAEDVLMETHNDLMKTDTEWLTKTSDSCTIVAALIATVAFATSASVPGGSKSNGQPVLKRELMFEVFSISSLGALCFSLTAVVMFLAILTSRHQATNFGSDLPTKLLIGLTALFLSIASVLVSFCGGHFFILKDVLRGARIAEYVVAVIPVTVFAIAQCPLYVRLFWATLKKVPERGFMLTTGGQERREPTKASPKLRFTIKKHEEDPSSTH